MRPIVSVLGGLALLAAGCATPQPTPLVSASPTGPAVTPAATTAPATMIATPAPPSVGGYRWTVVDPAQFGVVLLNAATTTADGRLLTLGDAMIVNGGPQHPTAWVSGDGLAWTRLPPSDAFAPPRPFWHEKVLDLVPFAGGYVATGMEQQDDGSSANAAAWFSPDGSTWSRATVADGAGRTMDQAIATPGGLVALGEAGYSFHAGMGAGTAIWTSRDGRTWAKVPAAESPPVGARLRAVIAAPSGFLATASFELGAGTTQGPVPPVTAGIWRSTDAIHWQAVPGSPLGVAGIARTAGDLVAVGSGQADLSAAALAWRSSDGRTWSGERLPSAAAVPPGVEVWAQSVVAGSAGLLAFGERPDTYTAVAWSSPDGATWSAASLPIPAGATIDRAYPFGTSILVTGRYQPDTGATLPALWLLTPVR